MKSSDRRSFLKAGASAAVVAGSTVGPLAGVFSISAQAQTAAGDTLMVRGTDATVALDVASRTALDPAKERAVLTSLARTIAAIDGARAITSDHINEASTFYRHVERQAFLGAYGKDVDHVSAG